MSAAPTDEKSEKSTEAELVEFLPVDKESPAEGVGEPPAGEGREGPAEERPQTAAGPEGVGAEARAEAGAGAEAETSQRPVVDLLDFEGVEARALELEGAPPPSLDLLDFEGVDEQAERKAASEVPAEIRLGATWLQAAALGLLSLSFVLLGLFRLPGVTAEVQGAFLFAGSLVLLLGGERLYRLDSESYYPRGLTFGGLKLGYGGAWALHFHLELVGADQFLALWLGLFGLHLGLTQRYRSQTLHASAVLLAIIGTSLALDLNYLNTTGYLAGLAAAVGLGTGAALLRSRETAVLGALGAGLLWLGLVVAGVEGLGGIPVGGLEREVGLVAGLSVVALALALQPFLAPRPCLVGELHPLLPQSYSLYGAAVVLAGTAGLAAGLVAGATGEGAATEQGARLAAGALLALTLYGLLAGHLPLDKREPRPLRWAVGGGGALLLVAAVHWNLHQGLGLVAAAILIGGGGGLVVWQLRRLSEALLAGGWVVLTGGLILTAAVGWVGPEGLGQGLVVLHALFALLLWKRSAQALALLLAPVLAVWVVLIHGLLGGRDTEGWPALLVALYLGGVCLMQAYLRPGLRPFKVLVSGGSEGRDWLRGKSWLHLYNLGLGASLLAGAVAAAHLTGSWQTLALVLPLMGFAGLHMVHGGAWGRLGLPAAWLALAGPAVLWLPVPLLLQGGALALGVLLVVLRHHPQDWKLLVLIFAAAGVGTFAGTVQVEGVDTDLRWLMMGGVLAIFTAVFPRAKEQWSVPFGAQAALIIAYGAAPAFPGPYVLAFGTLLLWALFTLEPPERAGRYQKLVNPFLGGLTVMWLLIFGFTGDMTWEGVWALHFGGLLLVGLEAYRRGTEQSEGGWLAVGLLLVLAPALVTQKEEAAGYLGVFSVGVMMLAATHWAGRPVAWVVPWGAAALAGLHLFGLASQPPRELLGWELTRDMAVVTLLVLLVLGVTGPNRRHYRWYEVTAAGLLLLAASSTDLQLKGDWAGLVVAAPVVGPTLFLLGLNHRDVVSCPVGYLGALAVVYGGLNIWKGQEAAVVGLVMGLLLLFFFALVWLRWGPGEPITFGLSFTALLLLLPAYFYLAPLTERDHLLAANLVYASVGNLALAGGFLLERRYLRLGAWGFLMGALLLNLWALPTLGGGLFALSLAYLAGVLLLVSLAYWWKQQAGQTLSG